MGIRHTAKLAAINLLVLGVISLPLTLPLVVITASLNRAVDQVRRNGEVSELDHNLLSPIRLIGRKLYMSVPFRNVIQYNSDCFAADKKYLYMPIANSSCIQSDIEYNNKIRFGRHNNRLHHPHSDEELATTIVLGDSHAMGWGVSDTEIFTAHLANQGINSINLAVSSYGTARQLSRLEDFQKGNPRDYEKVSTIIIQYCDNDHSENTKFLNSSRQKVIFPSNKLIYNFRNLLEAPNNTHIPHGTPPMAVFLNPIIASESIKHFYNVILTELRIRPFKMFHVAQREKPSHHEKSQALAFFAVLDRFQGVLEGKRIIVFVSNSWGESVASVSNAFSSFDHTDEDTRLYPGDWMSIITPLKGRQAGTGYYYLDGHLNPRGHKIVADSILNVLHPEQHAHK